MKNKKNKKELDLLQLEKKNRPNPEFLIREEIKRLKDKFSDVLKD